MSTRFATFETLRRASLSLLFAAFVCSGFFGGAVDVRAQTDAPELEQLEIYEFPFENVDARPVVGALTLSPDKKTIYVGGDNRRVYAWDAATKAVPVFAELDDWTRGLAVSPTAPDELATLTQAGQLQIWNAKTRTLLRQAREKVLGARDFVYSPNGKLIAVCGFESRIAFFNADKLDMRTLWDAPDESSTSIRFSPNGSLLAIAGRNGVVRVWTTEDGKVAREFKSNGNRRVRAVAFSPDGSLVAAGGDGSLVEIWNVSTGAKVAELALGGGRVFSLTFCGPGKIATGDSLNYVRLWDVASKAEIARGVGHTGTVAVLQFDATDSTLLSGGFDTTVVKWRIP
ncbi:MAG: hypothetical protein IKU86_01390 [Thermoguttaceae bacterium]|nr:hypothetical protein [Thermoguttaceae bacterium]